MWTVGQEILKDFIVEGELGRGGMGTVYLVRSRSTSERFAVKKLHLDDENSQHDASPRGEPRAFAQEMGRENQEGKDGSSEQKKGHAPIVPCGALYPLK